MESNSHTTLVISAYEELQKEIIQNRNKTDFDLLAKETLEQFHKAISNWNSNDSIEFVWNYVIGKNANAVSAEGQATITKKNFRIFFDDQETQKKIRQLLLIRKSLPLDEQVIEHIEKVRLHEHLEKYTFLRGYKPRLYVNRLLLMIFIEVMTTIAFDKELNRKTKKLGIKKEKSFVKSQFLLRQKVNEELIKANIIPSTMFEKATVSWHI